MNIFEGKPHLPVERTAFTALLSGSMGGLATTTAVACGLLISLEDPEVVLLGVAVSFLVQAVNSSTTWFFVEETEEEIDRYKDWRGLRRPFRDSLLQFLSHSLASLLVILPLFLIDNPSSAIGLTVGLSLAALFGLGVAKARLLKADGWEDGTEALILGAVVIAAGIISGVVLSG